MRLAKRISLGLAAILPLLALLGSSCGGDSSVVQPHCYDLNLDIVGSGSVEVDPDSSCYHSGSITYLTATPNNGYRFDHWVANVTWDPGADTLDYINLTFGTEDIDITAHFVYALELGADVFPPGAGTIDIDPDEAYYNPLDSVILEAIADSDHEFAYWVLGDETYDYNPIMLTFGTGDVEITAYFYTLYEGEPDCGDSHLDSYNGGCNSTPPVFQPILDDETIEGTSGVFTRNDSLFRDTDWYEYVATGNEQLTFSVTADFTAYGYIIADLGGCDNLGIVDEDSTMAQGQTMTLTGSVPAGTYYLFVAPYAAVWDCPVDYTMTFSAVPATSAAQLEPMPFDKKRLSDILR